MTRRIFRSIFLVALAVLLGSMTLVMGAVHAYFTQVQLDQLRTETALAAQGLMNQGAEFFENMPREPGCRITWIDGSGGVLYDNHLAPEGMENHLKRQEVAQALETGYGESLRYSSSLMERSIYTAQRLPDGTVLRLSGSQPTVFRLALGMGQYVLAILVLTGLAALALSHRLSKDIVRPINELNLDTPLANREYEEIMPLLQRLESQQAQLRGKSLELKQKQKEFNTVTRALSEGLVLMNASGTILSINPAAAQLLDVTPNCLGADFSVANRNPDIAALVESAMAGQKREQTLCLGEGKYLAAASPVRSEGAAFGVVLLLFDVTQKQRSEELRREFTANVSHELKTPLHVISGYAELMKSGMVPPEDMTRFSEKIYSEAQRLMTLVEDTLRLSRMEEGTEDFQWTQVELFSSVQAALRAVSAAAELNQVELILEGGPAAPFRAIPQLVSAIIFNLADNAVKYSRAGGTVTVRVEEKPEGVLLTVADQGVGIPKSCQDRVFERFYRVDKSHSKAVGGTGLGLSIVKHAASILNAQVTLESAPEAGTTVKVLFPL